MEEEQIERASSIEVAQNGKGDYSFRAKIYYDEMKRDYKDVITDIDNIYRELHARFK